MADWWENLAKNPSGLLTGDALGGNQTKAADHDQAAIDALNGISTPKLDPIALQQEKWLGDVDPTLQTAVPDVTYHGTNAQVAQAGLAGPSAYADVTGDPRLKDDQQASLGALKDLADHGGMNLTDKANLNDIQNQAATADRGRREAILQNAAQRGMGGSGSELLAQLSSSQAATNQQSKAGLDVAAQAQQRALQAMMESGNLAGSMRNQDFGEQSQIASAKDAIAKFNAGQTQNSNQYNATAGTSNDQFNAANQLRTDISNSGKNQGVIAANADATNKANYYNNNGAQGVANNNTGIANNEIGYNAKLPQQDFDNSFKKATGIAGGETKAAGTQAGFAAGNADALSNFESGGAQLASENMKDKAPAASAAAMAHGGPVPGKAPYPGDSYGNDTKLAKLSPGEFVLPRSVVGEIADKAGVDPDHMSRTQDPLDIEAFMSSLTGANPKRNKSIGGGMDHHVAALAHLAGKKVF